MKTAVSALRGSPPNGGPAFRLFSAPPGGIRIRSEFFVPNIPICTRIFIPSTPFPPNGRQKNRLEGERPPIGRFLHRPAGPTFRAFPLFPFENKLFFIRDSGRIRQKSIHIGLHTLKYPFWIRFSTESVDFRAGFGQTGETEKAPGNPPPDSRELSVQPFLMRSR